MPLHQLRIKKGFDLHAVGRPVAPITALPEPDRVALLPVHIPYLKPRLLAAEGDELQIGTPLVADKRDPRIQFLSPGGGRISQIRMGPRRVIESIVIERRTVDEPGVSFSTLSYEALGSIERGRLVELILQGGMWWVFRELPFRDWPDPDAEPPLIFVALAAKEPHLPQSAVYLDGRQDLFRYGLVVLDRLAGGRVAIIAAEEDNPMAGDGPADRTTYMVRGRYPADDPGTVLYHIKRSSAENRAWFISGQDLLLLAELLQHGRYPTERVVCIGGHHGAAPSYYRTRLGVPLAQLRPREPAGDRLRYIVGGMLRGFSASPEGFMGLYETALNVLPDEQPAEFLALVRPGLHKPTFSRTFLSRLNPRPLTIDSRMHGESRACIACLHCVQVCPVDIMPLLAYKALLADEIEEALAHGLLDCVECGLCAYVCPSKIELTRTFITAKAAYAGERAE